MGKISQIQRVKLITGFIFKSESFYQKAKDILCAKFGKIDFESETLTFIYTNYYEKEIGKELLRKFVSFAKLIPPEEITKIKILTNKIENRLSYKKQRKINIDPGYLDMAKLVLATTKDYKHRIYLNKGIFAEITLFYQDKTFQPWEWTYPDYKTPQYIRIFNQIRQIYEHQISK
jgi:hypothetical protein